MIAVAASALAGAALASEAAAVATSTRGVLPEGAGRSVVAKGCSQCHSLDVVTSVRLTRKQWDAKIDQMLARGAVLSDEEIEIAAEYLAHNFGPAQQPERAHAQAN